MTRCPLLYDRYSKIKEKRKRKKERKKNSDNGKRKDGQIGSR